MTTASKPNEVESSESRPIWSYPLIVGLGFLGVTAVYGGGSLVLDPTGGLLGLPQEWLAGTVFTDYLIPGLVLLGLLGGGSFAVLYGIVRRTGWAWPAGVALGIATVIWIVVQLAVIRRTFFLQPVIAGLGASFVVLLALPSMRRYYRAEGALSLLAD